MRAISTRWIKGVFLALIALAFIVPAACCPANNAPAIVSLTATPDDVGMGGSSTIVCVAADADGDTLTYSWTATGGTFNGAGDTVVWIAPNEEGTFTITVTVTDGKGGAATASAQVTVVGGTGSLNINSDPVGAQVYLDGQDMGATTPFVISGLAEGGYTLLLTYYHYKYMEGTVTISEDLVTYIDWTLLPAYETSAIFPHDPAVGNDAYVLEDSPVQNFGSEVYLFAGSAVADEKYRSYLQFNVSAIPQTAIIVEATLGLYYDGSSASIPTTIGAYKVIGSWDEDNIDWAHQPASAGTPEDTVSVPATDTQNYLYWDVTDLVQGWVDGSISNRGLVVRDTDEGTVKAWKRFISSNQVFHLDRNPRLDVTYFDPA